jgi:hypothetical protein
VVAPASFKNHKINFDSVNTVQNDKLQKRNEHFELRLEVICHSLLQLGNTLFYDE